MSQISALRLSSAEGALRLLLIMKKKNGYVLLKHWDTESEIWCEEILCPWWWWWCPSSDEECGDRAVMIMVMKNVIYNHLFGSESL